MNQMIIVIYFNMTWIITDKLVFVFECMIKITSSLPPQMITNYVNINELNDQDGMMKVFNFYWQSWCVWSKELVKNLLKEYIPTIKSAIILPFATGMAIVDIKAIQAKGKVCDMIMRHRRYFMCDIYHFLTLKILEKFVVNNQIPYIVNNTYGLQSLSILKSIRTTSLNPKYHLDVVIKVPIKIIWSLLVALLQIDFQYFQL
ncbi:hypothetical protein RFI_01377 [Reticulomyxa filosa]|uniref:Thioredoxin domain-containing protein n=1 Tax=Reticulomyxa filosa TaxID=46433 RepID=X6PBY1_RETFI|nr:hypothetical protein RFI_01377 [Reticulomyxa filosa]|eukprot:ETO35686.1 hypothetical protein RFI_01377 [Reticulomyxa filosa]